MWGGEKKVYYTVKCNPLQCNRNNLKTRDVVGSQPPPFGVPSKKIVVKTGSHTLYTTPVLFDVNNHPILLFVISHRLSFPPVQHSDWCLYHEPGHESCNNRPKGHLSRSTVLLFLVFLVNMTVDYYWLTQNRGLLINVKVSFESLRVTEFCMCTRVGEGVYIKTISDSIVWFFYSVHKLL